MQEPWCRRDIGHARSGCRSSETYEPLAAGGATFGGFWGRAFVTEMAGVALGHACDDSVHENARKVRHVSRMSHLQSHLKGLEEAVVGGLAQLILVPPKSLRTKCAHPRHHRHPTEFEGRRLEGSRVAPRC